MDGAKVAQFWEWFAANAARLSKFESDQARLAKELAEALRRLHQPEGYAGRGPGLSFDFGPRCGGAREFIISAEAIPSAFHLARELAAAAPPIAGWKVGALIPRKNLDLLLAQCRMGPDDVWFKAARAGERINVSVFVRDIRPIYEQDISEVRSFLIYVLGEETFGTRIGAFDCQRLPSDPPAWGLRPLRELPGFVDQEAPPARVNGVA